MVDIGQTWKLVLTLLHNDQGQDGKIRTDNATPHRFPLPLTVASWSIAGMSLRQQEPNTRRMHNPLLHWKSLLIVSSGDLKDVPLELVTNSVTLDLLTHTLVHENAETTLIVNIDKLLSAMGGISVNCQKEGCQLMDCVNMGIDTNNCAKLRYCIGAVEVHTPRWIAQSVKTLPRIPYRVFKSDLVGITYNIEFHFNDLLSGSVRCFVKWRFLSVDVGNSIVGNLLGCRCIE